VTPPRRGPRRRLGPGERDDLERRLEGWLEAHPEALRPLGFDLAVEQRQMLCTPGHDGTIDLLCRRLDREASYVVVELKVDDEIRRDAVAQVLGYVGWLRSRPGVEDAAGLIIGLAPHTQVPWVLGVLPEGLVRVAHWDELAVSGDLARDLGLRR
jgi:RecB family endonuclease NucS